MEEELNLDLDNNEEITRKDSRIKSLSEKVKLTSEERDEKNRLLLEKETALTSTSKERDFYKGFNQVAAKYPGANEYQEKILEKVNAGYDVEDATISILAKEGKYTPTQPVAERERAAGGSAATTIQGNDSKTPQEMTQDERRAQLLDIESQGGLNL